MGRQRVTQVLPASSMNKLKTYYFLTKPGIVQSNALMAMAGYFYGAHGHVDVTVLIAVVIGIAAVIGSACVYNNIMDRGIDARMDRTRKRALVSGAVSVPAALSFATVLLLLGLTILYFGSNLLAAAVALFGHFAYVILYGYAKRVSIHGTLIGTLSGSTPPVIGYAAATGRLDIAAALLFVLLAAWQMPHFFAIAIFRRDDYKRAGIPVLSVVRGLEATRKQIIAYATLYLVAVLAFGIFGGASLLLTLIVALASLYWLYLCFQPVGESIEKWARRQFGWSLWVLLTMIGTISLDSFWH